MRDKRDSRVSHRIQLGLTPLPSPRAMLRVGGSVKRLALAAAIVGILGVVWLSLVPDVSSPAQVSKPMATPGSTYRAATFVEPMQQRVPEGPPIEVRVRLSTYSEWSASGSMNIHAPEYRWMPAIDAGWPDLETADRLRFFPDEDTEEARLALIDAAERDGLYDVDPSEMEDQWEGMLALWAHYLSWQDDDLDTEDEELDRWQWIADEVQQVADADPHSEPGESLRYCLGLIADNVDVELDFDPMRDLADLVYSEDEALALTVLQDMVWDDDVSLDQLAALPIPDDTTERAIARSGLEEAVQSKDWASAHEWAETLELAPGLEQVDLDDLESVRGLLASMSYEPATDWRTELTAAVWSCHERVPVVGKEQVTWHIIGKEWQLQPTTGTPLETCLGAWEPTWPGPEEAPVVLSVLGFPVIN